MKIAIIGAGPRGLVLTEKLLKQTNQNIDITLFDPAPIGGRVWDSSLLLNQEFILNTISSQISYTDDGDSLYQWIEKDAEDYIKENNYPVIYLNDLEKNPNNYLHRGLLGIYSAWHFDNILNSLDENTVTHIQKKVDKVSKVDDTFKVEFDNQSDNFDQVVLALGHPTNKLNSQEQSFFDFAEIEKDRFYIAPNHPSEEEHLKDIPTGEPVIVRGLGLSFYDYITELTQGRGGKIEVDEITGEMTYQPSGDEPVIIAGSRGGLPIHARGDNQKGPSELYQPEFFEIEELDKVKDENGHITYQQFFDLFSKEMQTIHYKNVINSEYGESITDKKEFLDKLKQTDVNDYSKIAKEFNVDLEMIWDWNRLMHANQYQPNDGDLSQWWIDYLQRDVEYAKLGNKNAPYTAAFDIMRDVRDRIRFIVEHDYFTADQYQIFLKEFTPINVLLSVGPPRRRVEEIIAYIKAGVLKITGPGIAVETSNDYYVATTNRQGEIYQAKSLIEARLFTSDIVNSDESLQKDLLTNGQIRQVDIQSDNGSNLLLGAFEIDKDTYNVIDNNGDAIENFYSFGVPHEGLKWFTTVIPRPGVNTIIFRETDAIVKRIFK